MWYNLTLYIVAIGSLDSLCIRSAREELLRCNNELYTYVQQQQQQHQKIKYK